MARVAVAATDPSAAFLDTLALEHVQDHRAVDPDDLAAAYMALCDEGVQPACRHKAWRSSSAPSLKRLRERMEPLCVEGDQAACVALGWTYSQVQPGIVSPEADDLPRARGLFEAACEAGFTRGCAGLGWLQLQSVERDPAGALARFQPLCEAEDGPSCRGAGDALLALDPEEGLRDALGWYQRGAALSDPASLLRQGEALLQSGRPKTATSRFQKACEGGAPAGCGELGVLVGGAEGQAWLERGCASGDGDSCGSLAEVLADTDRGRARESAKLGCDRYSAESCLVQYELFIEDLLAKTGEKGDLFRAERAVQLACKWRSAEACHTYGLLDVHWGLEFIERACLLGDSKACARLMAVQLESDPPNPDAVLARSEPLCAQGDGLACLWAASALWKRGPEYHAEVARRYESACAAGEGRGCVLVGRLYEFGIERRHDPEQALAIYRRACYELGSPYACTELGHTHNRLRPDEPGPALRFFEESCAADDAGACIALARHQEKQEAPQEQRLSTLRKGCFGTHGYIDTCLAYEPEMMRSGLPMAATLSNDALLQACKMGHRPTCPLMKKVRWPWPEPSGPMLDAEKLCHRADDDDCLVAVTRAVMGEKPTPEHRVRYAHLLQPACMIEPDLCKFEADKEELEERKIDLYERACLVGNDADSCAKAAAMYDSGEVKAPNDRHIIELAARSCTAKPEHEFYCGDLMDYLERHSCGPVACTLAYANLCHSEVDPSRCLEAGRRVLGGIGAEIDIDRAYDLLLVGCRHFDAEACKVGKRTVKDARD